MSSQKKSSSSKGSWNGFWGFKKVPVFLAYRSIFCTWDYVILTSVDLEVSGPESYQTKKTWAQERSLSDVFSDVLRSVGCNSGHFGICNLTEDYAINRLSWTPVRVQSLCEDLDLEQNSWRYWLSWLFLFTIRLEPAPEEELDPDSLWRLWRKQSCDQCYSPVTKRDVRFKGTVQHFRKYSCSLFQWGGVPQGGILGPLLLSLNLLEI